VILLGDGRAVADAAPAEVLAGGWYFATQVARVLGGAGGALTAQEGAAVVRGAAAHDDVHVRGGAAA
jgi:energy-coupling factor transport system ATP-binding protein